MNVLDLLGSDSKYYGINGVILYKIMCSLSVVKYLSYKVALGCKFELLYAVIKDIRRTV